MKRKTAALASTIAAGLTLAAASARAQEIDPNTLRVERSCDGHNGPIVYIDNDTDVTFPVEQHYTASFSDYRLAIGPNQEWQLMSTFHNPQTANTITNAAVEAFRTGSSSSRLNPNQRAFYDVIVDRVEDGFPIVYDRVFEEGIAQLHLGIDSLVENYGTYGYPEGEEPNIGRSDLRNNRLDTGRNGESVEALPNYLENGSGNNWNLAEFRESTHPDQIDQWLTLSYPGQPVCYQIDFEEGSWRNQAIKPEMGVPTQTIIDYLEAGNEPVHVNNNNWGLGIGVTALIDSNDVITIGPSVYTTVAGQHGNYLQLEAGARFSLPDEGETYAVGSTLEDELFEGTQTTVHESEARTDLSAGFGYGHRFSDALSLVPHMGFQLGIAQVEEVRRTNLYDYTIDEEQAQWVHVEGSETINPVNHGVEHIPGAYLGLGARIHSGEEQGRGGFTTGFGVAGSVMVSQDPVFGAMLYLNFGGDGVGLTRDNMAGRLDYGPDVYNPRENRDN